MSLLCLSERSIQLTDHVSPTRSETSPSDSPEVFDQVKATADNVTSRAQEIINDKVKPVINDKVKPTLFDAYQSASEYITGQDVVGQASSTLQSSQRKATKAAKDISSRTQNAVNGMGGIGAASDVQLMSGSPARNLRNAGAAVATTAGQAAEVVGPVANRVGEIVMEGADRGIVAWEQYGRREAKQFVRHAQEVRPLDIVPSCAFKN